ncbi:ABC transporter permease subunit [Spirochaeta isovalerica]|uniref:Sodium transport system permease protein n=1 Tax=Spirochaeta isovalerica TaxID=150 RepID=A0A841R9S1_9SPIO|nr:sodium transport system permease protein [Spirochaeta isovalerica]
MFTDALIIMRKEFLNLFKSKRTMLMTFGLPLILFPVLFSGMAAVEKKQNEEKAGSIYYVEFQRFGDDRFSDILATKISYIESDQGVSDQSLVIRNRGGEVEILYDSSSSRMTYAADKAEEALREYNDLLGDSILEQAGLKREDLQIFRIRKTDTAPEEKKGGALFAVFIPYILILFLLIGAMSLVLDVTAGEKERGTIAVLLVNQISRTSIALGKTFYVIICSILNSFSSVIGMGLGMIILLRGSGAVDNFSLALFSPLKILQLLLVLVSVSSVVSSLMVYLGSLARNLKEGGSYVMPVYMLGLFAVVITMNMEAAAGPVYYMIPLVNGVFVMKSLLTEGFPPLEFLLCLGSNLLITALFVFRTSRLYNSERVLKTV